MPVNLSVYQSLKSMLLASGQLDLVIQAFIDNSAVRLGDLHLAIQAQSFTKISEITHAIKGSCSMLGCARCTELCEAIETAAKRKNIADVQIFTNKLHEDIDAVILFLKRDRSGPSQGCCE
jgi:HPt (histidine-containing phosphotransfer) domain-containing protein